MRVPETTAELRRICQSNRESTIYQMNWMDRNVTRRLSIHITRLFIRLGISADRTTILDFLFVLLAGLYFSSVFPVLWLAGLACFLLYMLLDCVDGEIARYAAHKGLDNRPPGAGAIVCGAVDWFTWPYLLAGMSIGVYLSTGNLLAIIAGFWAVIGRWLYMDIGLMPYPYLHEKGKLSSLEEQTNAGGPPKEGRAATSGRLLFGAQGFTVSIILISIGDIIFGGTLVASLGVNMRLLYLVLFALASTAGVVVKLRTARRYGAIVGRI